MLKELGWCSGSSSVEGIQSALRESDCWRSPGRYHLRSKARGVLGGSILLRTSAEGILYLTISKSPELLLGMWKREHLIFAHRKEENDERRHGDGERESFVDKKFILRNPRDHPFYIDTVLTYIRISINLKR